MHKATVETQLSIECFDHHDAEKTLERIKQEILDNLPTGMSKAAFDLIHEAHIPKKDGSFTDMTETNWVDAGNDWIKENLSETVEDREVVLDFVGHLFAMLDICEARSKMDCRPLWWAERGVQLIEFREDAGIMRTKLIEASPTSLVGFMRSMLQDEDECKKEKGEQKDE